ncbi:MAG: 4-amino-4-deoxy-L-arabinose transferase and related glycosyltransferase of family-like protein [Myxococcales bacterium]|nr:4-amino-4-deoxy-L-arabinose transferase and related glycosyltransferase of family-like protein [Myxococcales bacterium]
MPADPVDVSARRSLGLQLALVVIVSLAVLVPGISSYSLVDPWETHYGEVARNMLKDHDLVHMQWPGTNEQSQANEGFRSKPVLTFWLMAAGMRAVGLADHGGYSGEMVHDGRTMIALRLPFILFAVLGLTLLWWMLARLVSCRVAWLGLLVVGSCPFFCLVARQGITDMPLTACVMGALAMFTLAVEDGDHPISTVFTLCVPRTERRFAIDQRHVVFALCGGLVLTQAAYYAAYFTASPRLAVVGFPNPAIVLPVMMIVMLGALSRDGWLIVRSPLILIGAGAAAALGERVPRGPARPSRWRSLIDGVLVPWERHSLDRYIVRALVFPIAWAMGRRWAATNAIANRIVEMRPIVSTRQVYLLWCYAFLGLSILAKGPPGLAVVGVVGIFYIVVTGRWRAFYEGAFELKRGLLLMIVIFLPWHVAMFLKEGAAFINEYLFNHIVDRAAVGSVDKSFGTFESYTSQIGHGMWLWAALLPAAVAAVLLRTHTDTREGRVRFMMALWAIGGFAFFGLVQTKFHHYILPVVPALGVLVAFFLDDLWTGRERLHPLYAGIGIGIVLLVTRDLIGEPERWIEMFIYRYDRPWPSGEPWQVDPSDGFLALGCIAAVAIASAALRWRRVGVVLLGAAGLAICVWSLQAYMPIAGKHWGMREAMRTYYEQRTIYGEKLLYFGPREVTDDWAGVGNTKWFETFVPDKLQIGQPMTIEVQVNKAEDDRIMLQDLTLIGSVSSIRDHAVEITFPTSERAKLEPLIQQGAGGRRGRPPVDAVDADRLIVWILYWRGEQFWSGGEVWDSLPEMKTTFQQPNNVELTKYLNDRARAPLGRRYFVITESGRVASMRSLLPTQRARDSFEVLDTTSNKFSIAAFYL